MAFPSVLYAVELPKGSDEWHALDSAEVAGVLRDAGYTVRPYAAIVSLMEATGDENLMEHARGDDPHSLATSRGIVRRFITRYSRGVR
jgi:hypothetical protein